MKVTTNSGVIFLRKASLFQARIYKNMIWINKNNK